MKGRETWGVGVGRKERKGHREIGDRKEKEEKGKAVWTEIII